MQNHRFGLVRVAAATPVVAVGNPLENVGRMLELVEQAAHERVQLVVFPELCISGYTCADLFHQRLLRTESLKALGVFLEGAQSYGDTICIVGLPLVVDEQLFNVAAVCQNGKILGIVPKTYLPNHKEFYEQRWFQPATKLRSHETSVCDQTVPIGTDLIFKGSFSDWRSVDPFCFGVEICEDLWVRIPPSSPLALWGATILCNLSASNSLIGKADYRRQLVTQQSARCLAAYVYAACGPGESTADLVWDGHSIVAENGTSLGESERWSEEAQLVIQDIDVERLAHERTMTSSFGQEVGDLERRPRIIQCPAFGASAEQILRVIDRHPFVPSDKTRRDEVCQEVFAHMRAGLRHRLRHLEKRTKSRRTVIGVSGGLDSTLALLVLAQIYDDLHWDRAEIIAVQMPGIGTTDRTHQNAETLIKALGVTHKVIYIEEAVRLTLKSIGAHDGGEPCWHCLTCQNTQARERTKLLMDMGFVIGTGDLTEIALGWSTYNGDQQSMYNPNCDASKLLIRSVTAWVAEKDLIPAATKAIADIVDTPYDPELEKRTEGKRSKTTEEQIGPYELHEFFLFHLLRNGFGPEKIARWTGLAFGDKYDEQTILKWLRVFYVRFGDAQFKRENVPNGPKIGSVALSPRGDWRMPPDISLDLWIREVDRLIAGRTG